MSVKKSKLQKYLKDFNKIVLIVADLISIPNAYLEIFAKCLLRFIQQSNHVTYYLHVLKKTWSFYSVCLFNTLVNKNTWNGCVCKFYNIICYIV